MQVSKWGNSLAIRFPAALVQALDLKEGEEVELHLVGHRSFEVIKKPSAAELLARLQQFRGRLPADFHFDRIQANERNGTL
jgi:antitoxin MazE